MSRPVTVALVGTSGYGLFYLNPFLDDVARFDLKLVGVIDPFPDRCPRRTELASRGIPCFPTLEDFFVDQTAELVIIASPIPSHAAQTLTALRHGAHVLCEKPAAATIQDARRMAEAARAAGRFVAIGFQWSFAESTQALKADILRGDFGAPVRARALVLWSRNANYYARNAWAGALKTVNGDWVLDSPLHNATAHYLHHMLYLLGPTRETAATPTQVQAELYRANRIGNFDTAAFRCHTGSGVEVLFYTSHAVPSDINPIFCLEFEKAVVSNGNGFVAHLSDGSLRRYGDPGAQSDCGKITQVLESVRTGSAPHCDIETAIPQVLCINAAQESMPRVRVFPSDMVNIEGRPPNELTWVTGLVPAFIQCWGMGILPSEHGGMPWARPSRMVDVTHYTTFPQSPVLLGGAGADGCNA